MPSPAETVSIQLDRQTADALESQARARGISLDTYLRDIAQTGASPDDGGGAGLVHLADVDRWLEELSEGLPTATSLPPDFSREDIYRDHD